MFHDRNLNNKINKMQLRALRIAYRDYGSDFETLLKREISVTVHQRNLRLLMVEIYKTKENLNPEFMKDIFITNFFFFFFINITLKKLQYNNLSQS